MEGEVVLHKRGSTSVVRPPGCHKGQDLLDEIARDRPWVSAQGEDEAGHKPAMVAAAESEALTEAVHCRPGAGWHRSEDLADEVGVAGLDGFEGTAFPAGPTTLWVADGGSDRSGHIQRLLEEAAWRGAGKLQLGPVGTSEEGNPGQRDHCLAAGVSQESWGRIQAVVREPYEWTAHKVTDGEVEEVQGTITGVGVGGVTREEVGVGDRIRATVPQSRTPWVRARDRARARARAEVGPCRRVMGCRAETPRAQMVVAVLALSCRRRSTPLAREDRVGHGWLSWE